MGLSLNMVGDEVTNFAHKLLLTNRQIENLRKAIANNSSNDTNLSKTHLSVYYNLVNFLLDFLIHY